MRQVKSGQKSLGQVRYEADNCFTLNSRGKMLAGWPRMTKRRELSLRRLESKSSKDCSRNLHIQTFLWKNKTLKKDFK